MGMLPQGQGADSLGTEAGSMLSRRKIMKRMAFFAIPLVGSAVVGASAMADNTAATGSVGVNVGSTGGGGNTASGGGGGRGNGGGKKRRGGGGKGKSKSKSKSGSNNSFSVNSSNSNTAEGGAKIVFMLSASLQNRNATVGDTDAMVSGWHLVLADCPYDAALFFAFAEVVEEVDLIVF